MVRFQKCKQSGGVGINSVEIAGKEMVAGEVKVKEKSLSEREYESDALLPSATGTCFNSSNQSEVEPCLDTQRHRGWREHKTDYRK